MREKLPAAVLWDMDGTLIDSEPSWIRAQLRLVEEHHGTWTWEDGLSLVGADMAATAVAMHGAGVTLGDAEIIERLTSEVCDDLAGGITWRPGVVALVTALADAGIPQAIVTTSARTMAAIVAAQLPTDAIHVIVSGDDVSHGKPHPEPYLQAARLLNVDAARCIAVEDSPTGLASAVAAGTVAIAVPHDAVIPAGAGWTVLDTLEGVGPGELGALLGTQPADSGSGPVR